VLGDDDYLSVTYASPAVAAPVDLFVAYYDRQTEGTGIHSPEVCIPSGGWEVSDWEQTVLPVERAGGSTVPLPANRAVIRKGLQRQLVVYWFEQRGRRMTNDYLAKAATVWDALTRGRTDGALVRLITPMAPGESVAAAEARLAAFLGVGLAELPRFIPD
jgi:EpsI family protein